MKKKQVDIVDAINDPKLFGSLIPDLSTWGGVDRVPEGHFRDCHGSSRDRGLPKVHRPQ